MKILVSAWLMIAAGLLFGGKAQCRATMTLRLQGQRGSHENVSLACLLQRSDPGVISLKEALNRREASLFTSSNNRPTSLCDLGNSNYGSVSTLTSDSVSSDVVAEEVDNNTVSCYFTLYPAYPDILSDSVQCRFLLLYANHTVDVDIYSNIFYWKWQSISTVSTERMWQETSTLAFSSTEKIVDSKETFMPLNGSGIYTKKWSPVEASDNNNETPHRSITATALSVMFSSNCSICPSQASHESGTALQSAEDIKNWSGVTNWSRLMVTANALSVTTPETTAAYFRSSATPGHDLIFAVGSLLTAVEDKDTSPQPRGSSSTAQMFTSHLSSSVTLSFSTLPKVASTNTISESSHIVKNESYVTIRTTDGTDAPNYLASSSIIAPYTRFSTASDLQASSSTSVTSSFSLSHALELGNETAYSTVATPTMAAARNGTSSNQQSTTFGDDLLQVAVSTHVLPEESFIKYTDHKISADNHFTTSPSYTGGGNQSLLEGAIAADTLLNSSAYLGGAIVGCGLFVIITAATAKFVRYKYFSKVTSIRPTYTA